MSDYFRFTHPFWVITIGTGLYVLTLSVFSPQHFTLGYLGPLGRLSTYLGTHYPGGIMALFVVAVILHIGETIYSWILCRRKALSSGATLKWMIQTFLFGLSSLMLLTAYDPHYKKTAKD
ncbi:hypothetical protein CHS0354_008543 [Potamilus streckersoni]|uniref:Transmembrane protein 254 n=1 Tax=Potamilus streckersoni TaxID=2493646 RepID=A0AAE0TEL7_9BIVA|nr:hypothetical protein CHS0354_008543 [Potamilus streckersoni]